MFVCDRLYGRIVENDVLQLPTKYIVKLYVDNIDIRFDLQIETPSTWWKRNFFSRNFVRWPYHRPGSRTKDAIVESSTIYRIAVVIQKTYPEYAQSPGHTRLHNIKVSARRMCPELRANI